VQGLFLKFAGSGVLPEGISVREQDDRRCRGEKSPHQGRIRGAFPGSWALSGDREGEDPADLLGESVSGVLTGEERVGLGEVEVDLAGLRVAAEELVQFGALFRRGESVEEARGDESDPFETFETFVVIHAGSFLISCFSMQRCRAVRMRKRAWETAPSVLPSSRAIAWTLAPGR
jgi:hypothetical protein